MIKTVRVMRVSDIWVLSFGIVSDFDIRGNTFVKEVDAGEVIYER